MPRRPINKLDLQIAAHIKQRRTELGLSQADLAEALDLSSQQIYKYESGENRPSASLLYEIAQVLELSISAFFKSTIILDE